MKTAEESPITPEVEEFVRWAVVFHKEWLLCFSFKDDSIYWTSFYNENITKTTAELFDWWLKNVKK